MADISLSPAEQRVLAEFSRPGVETLTADDIYMGELGRNYMIHTIHRALAALLNYGLIERVSRGTYRLPSRS